MNRQRNDFLVGLFILTAVGVVVGALIVTSGLGEGRYDLFIRTASAENLTQDTRVVLRGLSVGRIRQVVPVIDTTTGAIEFVARLSVQDQFPNGAQLTLPRGTRAVISQPTPIAPPVIQLVVPDVFPGGFVDPGDTLSAERLPNVLDAVSEIATELRGTLSEVLADTRALMERTSATLRQAQGIMATNAPLVTQVLTQLSGNLERADRVLAEIEPRVAPLQDSIVATLADTRQLLAKMDTLVTTAHAMADENRDAVQEITGLLLRSAQILEHFSDQVSRRPTRLLTGVRPPPPPDSSRDQR